MPKATLTCMYGLQECTLHGALELNCILAALVYPECATKCTVPQSMITTHRRYNNHKFLHTPKALEIIVLYACDY